MAVEATRNGVSLEKMASFMPCVIFIMCWGVAVTASEPDYKFISATANQVTPIVSEVEYISLSRSKRDSGNDTADNATIGTSQNETNSTENPNNSPSSDTGGGSTPAPQPVTTNPFDEADVHFDHHDYYTSAASSHDVDSLWTELADPTQHATLSNSHRVAVVIPIQFPFYFYGHRVRNVTVATGGFIYMSHFLHQFLTATQYIAPLMANFDTSMSSDSKIFYQSKADRFTVEWKDVILRDQASVGPFHFQVVLHQNSSVEFLYKKVPTPVSNISTTRHPVKVGMSDAYYVDSVMSNNRIRRVINEYHKVLVDPNLVLPGTVILIDALPTCNRLTDCDSCTSHVNVSFECRWCNIIGRCSDRNDWYRQHWDKNGCNAVTVVDSSQCAALPPPSKPIDDPLKIPVVNKCQGDDCDGDGGSDGFPVAAVVVLVLLVLALVGAGLGWVYYAYTHPTSKSGMWLMEHRPSQIKAKIKFWKSSTSSGAKYQTETDA